MLKLQDFCLDDSYKNTDDGCAPFIDSTQQLMLSAIPAPILLHIQEVWRVSPSVVLNLSSMIRKLFANVDGDSYCLVRFAVLSVNSHSQTRSMLGRLIQETR
jgi:hypothetical protein